MDGFFGIGLGELFLIAIIALVVLGPERLPGALREVAKFIRTIRNMTNELTSQFGDEFKVLEDLNPQKILRDLAEDPDEKAATKTTAKPAAKPGVKPASSTTTKPTTTRPAATKPATTTTKPATSTAKPATASTTAKPAGTTSTTPKPSVTSPKTAGAPATSKPATVTKTVGEGAVVTAEETVVAVEEAPVAAAAGTGAAVQAQGVESVDATGQDTREGTNLEAPTVETAEGTVENLPAAGTSLAEETARGELASAAEGPEAEISVPDTQETEAIAAPAEEEVSILPPALRDRVLGDEVQSAAQGKVKDEVGGVEPAGVATDNVDAVTPPETGASIIEDEAPTHAHATEEATGEVAAESVTDALANTASETAPETVVPKDVVSENAEAGAGLEDEVSQEPASPSDDTQAKPKRPRAKPKSDIVPNSNGNGIHVNGNSTEGET